MANTTYTYRTTGQGTMANGNPTPTYTAYANGQAVATVTRWWHGSNAWGATTPTGHTGCAATRGAAVAAAVAAQQAAATPLCARCQQAPSNGAQGSTLCTPCAAAVLAAPSTPPPAAAVAAALAAAPTTRYNPHNPAQPYAATPPVATVPAGTVAGALNAYVAGVLVGTLTPLAAAQGNSNPWQATTPAGATSTHNGYQAALAALLAPYAPQGGHHMPLAMGGTA